MATATVTRLHAMLTVPEVCIELQISRSTFYDWRQKGRARGWSPPRDEHCIGAPARVRPAAPRGVQDAPG
jgi:transposase